VASAIPSDGIIRKPGKYVLQGERVSTAKWNVRVQADEVDLDLNGNVLQYDGALSQPSYGIYVSSGRNVTIRNGRIRGSQYGVCATGVQNLTVSNVDFTGCRYTGIHAAIAAVGLMVESCVFSQITGWPSNPYAIGISGVGVDAFIEHCQFRDLYRQPGVSGSGEGCGILLKAGASNAIIRNNWFENSAIKGEVVIGMWIAEGASALVYENTITNFGRGIIAGGIGTVVNNRLFMRAPEARSNAIHVKAGSAKLNLIVGYERPLSGFGEHSDNTILC
jgi:hypothetical protein